MLSDKEDMGIPDTTFSGFDAGDGVEDIARADHLQLTLRHRLASLPELSQQIPRCWRRPAGAVHL